MKKIEKKVAKFAPRFNELKKELDAALKSLAEQGWSISQKVADAHDFLLSDFRGNDGWWIGMRMACAEFNGYGKAVGDSEPCAILHMANGKEAHTEKLVPLRYISYEDRFYMSQYLHTLMEEEAKTNEDKPFSVLTPSYGEIFFKRIDSVSKGIEVYEMTDAKGGFCGEIDVNIGTLTDLTAKDVEERITDNLFL